VLDATAASKDRNNPIFCAVSDAAVASDTENHGSCKQTLKRPNKKTLPEQPTPMFKCHMHPFSLDVRYRNDWAQKTTLSLTTL
jgi:hypothetical protein